MPGTHIPLCDCVSEFGANVTARRRRLGMSQVQLAEKIGIGQDMLSRIETGQAFPKFRRLNAFAQALGCPVGALFMNATIEEQKRGEFIAELIHPLPPEWQKCVMQTVQQMVWAVRQTYGADAKAGDEDYEEETD